MKSKVAELIIKRQAELGISNRELAEAVGFPNQNVITMIRKRRTKLPPDKIGLFAKALQIDTAHLFRIVTKEYTPNKLKVIEECVGPIITQNERLLLELWRNATDHRDPRIPSPVAQGFTEILRLAVAIESED